MVVDKRPIENHATVRLKRPGNDICRVRLCAAIRGGPNTPFRVRLDDETAKVRNRGINLLGFLAPPLGHTSIEGIKSVQSADCFGASKVYGNGEPNPPRAKNICDTHKLRQKIVLKKTRVCIHIVDVAAVDAHGGQQTRVRANSLEVCAHAAVVKED